MNVFAKKIPAKKAGIEIYCCFTKDYEQPMLVPQFKHL
jgi:hypothetical protein